MPKFGPRCFSFATWKVILNQIVRNSGMQWQTSSIQDMKKLLSGVKASKTRLLSEAEARRKDKTQELAAKKMQGGDRGRDT